MSRKIFPRLVFLIMLWSLGGVSALALDPSLELDQYTVERYTTENGLPQSSVLAMTQTRDGYLWLGTYEGLARFDGLDFTIFNKANTPEMESNSIKALVEDRQGRLWVGTTAGLLVYDQGHFHRFDSRSGLTNSFILCLHLDRAGIIWTGTTDGLFRYQDNRFFQYTTAQGLSANYITALADDDRNGLWIGTGRGLNYLREGKVRTFDTRNGLPHNDIRALHLDAQGTLWIGSSGGGLFRFREGHIEALPTPTSSKDIRAIYQDRHGILWIGTNQEPLNRLKDGKISVLSQRLAGLMSARAILEDREGSLWVGTRDGLLQLKNDKFILYGARNGLPVDPVRAVFADRQQNIWIGTIGGGLVRFREGNWKIFNRSQGLLSDHIWSIAQSRDGTIWAGTYGGGLFRLPPAKQPEFFHKVKGLANDIIRAILVDRRDRTWVGTNGSGLYCLENGRITNFTTAEGLPSNYIYALGDDRQGRIWAGGYSGGISVLEGNRFRSLPNTAIAEQPVWTIYLDRENNAWVGTDHAGLLWIQGDRAFRFSSRDGLYSDQAFQILEDNRGRLWMNCNQGIYNVFKKDLIDFAAGKSRRIPCIAFGKSEGIKVTESSGPAQPAGCIDSRGRIWFPTIRGVSVFEPDRLHTNRVQPSLAIEKITINDRAYPLQKPAVAPPGKGNIEINYTAVSFLQVDKMQFAYRLEGFDSDWITAGNRRSAFYTNLPHGTYSFRIIASNGDGVWNKTGAAFTFTLKPFFHQTAPFRWLVALSSLLLLSGGLLLFLHRVRSRERRLEQLVQARTIQLQHLARYDGLTDLANHRTFYETFHREWQIASREKKSLALIAVDIDFFKPFNDTLGHQEGDACIKKVAQAIRAQAKRPADLAARTGGEEFFLLLPGTEESGALNMAESIRMAVENLAIAHPSSPIAAVVTISLGLAAIIPSATDAANLFITSADQALYRAKHSGRNRVSGPA